MSPRDFPRPRAAPDAVPLEGQPHPAGRDLRRELSSEGLALHFRRENLIDRSALVSQLKRSEHPLILLQGAAGYGKTALLHQWCEQDGRSFASLSLDAGDNDPLVLLAYALVALDTPSPVRDQLLAGPLADPAFLKAVTLPRLIERWASRTTPLVLVLDDVHVLRDPRCWTLIGALVEGLPEGSHIVLSEDVNRRFHSLAGKRTSSCCGLGSPTSACPQRRRRGSSRRMASG